MKTDATTRTSEREILIDPATPFAQVAQQVAAQGWHFQADATAPPPILAEEPEAAAWTRGSTRLLYTFQPATKLRVLALKGPDAESAAEKLQSELPSFGLDRAVAMLEGPETESVLRGLQAIEMLGRYEALGQVAELASNANATVARQARQTLARVVASAGAHVLRILGEWKQAHPELSSIFLLVGSAPNKLQILRWLAHDRAQSNPHIDAVLRTAFQDADWEVRVTAMVVAARLRARDLLREVSAVRLPEDTADGVNRDERRMLRSFQLAAIELLQGVPVPPPLRAPPTTRALMHDHLLRCLAGDAVAYHEKAFLHLTSLVTPLPDEVPGPPVFLPGIRAGDDGYVLEAHRIALCWVPPVEHWLGDELPRMQVANPIRNVRSAGFFVARDMSALPQLCNYDAAVDYCSRLSAATDLKIRLPTADEWEMAARGPDGRRFPWGNNARSEERFGASPWGMRDAVGRAAQWVSSPSEVLACGGEKQWVCAMREPASRDSLRAVRVVVEP